MEDYDLKEYGGEPVITVSSSNEELHTGLETIIRCKRYFGRRLHIVKEGFRPLDDMTQGERDALEEAGFEIIVHTKFDESKVTDRMAAIFIGPDLQVTEGGMQKLYTNMKNSNHRHSYFSVSSNIKFEGQNDWRDHQNWINIGSYGFLLVILMLDLFRSILNLTKYHRTCDLRAQTLTHAYPNKKTFTRRPFWGLSWILWTGVSGQNDGAADVLQIVSKTHSGWDFVFRTISQHAHMGLFNLKWGILFWTNYFLFSWPWWSRFLPPIPDTHWYYQVATFLLYRDMTNGFWIWFYSMQLVLVAICAWMYMDTPIHIATLSGQILLYPVYVALSPIIFLIGRLYRPTRSRKKMSSALTSNKKE